MESESGKQINIYPVENGQVEDLVPVLVLAEPSPRALRWGLRHLVDEAYRLDVDGQLAGAATMQWRDDPCELQELAIVAERQGQGLGKQFVRWLLDEARRRGKHGMLVGTTNASLSNIAFYQRCGFRMHHVRQDYFGYYRQPIYEYGIQVRDMLVFRYDLNSH